MALDPDTVARMAAAAKSARDKAYAPYSNHPVGSAILAEDGQIYASGNVENAAYPVGTCAEAGALAAMFQGGAREVKAVVIIGPRDVAVTPCGACRQRLNEFSADPNVPIVMVDTQLNPLLHTTIGDLLPHSFGPHNL